MLNKTTLEYILNDWNYWQEPPPLTIPRDILKHPLHLTPDLLLLVQGVRRCGKSTLLTQVMQRLQLDAKDCTFVNFEDPRLTDHLDHTLLDAIVHLSEERRPGKKLYFFFDEIQNVSQWQKWFHGKLERPKKNCFAITGSNASLLSGDIATSLTGRHTTIELFPFDYFEYQLAKPGASLTNYFDDGGFPRVLSYPDPQTLLRDYFTDIIERDVRRHVAVRSTLTLTQLVKAVFESTGSELSQRSLSKILGVTADTVKTYLDACESAYILMPCPYFTFSERQRSSRNTKYYPIDLGMRRAIITQTGADAGKSLETIVFHHLRKKYGRVFYWRQTGEIDFVVQDGKSILPFQVSWDGVKDRHIKSAAEFHKAFPKAEKVAHISSRNVVDWMGGRLNLDVLRHNDSEPTPD